MAYDFSNLKTQINDTKEWLRGEYAGIRTGRATPTLLDSVLVDAYGTRSPISQLASVSVEDARTLRISPWDGSLVKNIEKAITDANLGVSVATDEKGSRVSFPELTSERRESLIKLVRGRLEDARIAIRTERDKVWNDIQKQEKDGEISKDDKFRYKEDMQKIIDEANDELNEMTDRKEKEITS